MNGGMQVSYLVNPTGGGGGVVHISGSEVTPNHLRNGLGYKVINRTGQPTKNGKPSGFHTDKGDPNTVVALYNPMKNRHLPSTVFKTAHGLVSMMLPPGNYLYWNNSVVHGFPSRNTQNRLQLTTMTMNSNNNRNNNNNTKKKTIQVPIELQMTLEDILGG